MAECQEPLPGEAENQKGLREWMGSPKFKRGLGKEEFQKGDFK